MTGEELRVAREASGLSRKQLAKLVRISPSHLASIETGDKAGSLHAWLRLAAALGMGPESVLGEQVGVSADARAAHEADVRTLWGEG